MRLLKIEWLKLKNYRTFYILVGLFFGIFITINLLMRTAPFSVNIMKEKVSMFNDDFSFPQVWDNMSYYFGWAIIFICVLVIINICNEFSFKTRRQHIIDGYSRMDFLNGKALLILSINIVLTLAFIVIGLIIGYTNGGGDPSSHFIKVFQVFLLGMNYISFSALLALLIKRSGLTIMLLLAFVFVEEIIANVFKFNLKINISAYLPLQCSDDLFKTPFAPMARSLMEKGAYNPTTLMMIMSCVFVALYYFLARWKMKTTDL